MSKGSFIDIDGRFIFYGSRGDKPSLEDAHTFIKSKPPPFNGFDWPYHMNGEWVVKKDQNTPNTSELASILYHNDDMMIQFILDKVNGLERRIADMEGVAPPERKELEKELEESIKTRSIKSNRSS